MGKLYRSLLITLAICAVILFVLSGQTWATVVLADADLPTLEFTYSGRELTPILGSLIVIPATGVVGLIAAKGFISRLIGFAIFLSGLGLAYLPLAMSSNLEVYVDNLLQDQIGRSGIDYELSTNLFAQTLVVPAIGVSAVGIIFTLCNFDSSKKRAAYDANPYSKNTGETSAQNAALLNPWQAMDSGIDPTISISDGGDSSDGSAGSGSD